MARLSDAVRAVHRDMFDAEVADAADPSPPDIRPGLAWSRIRKLSRPTTRRRT